jgi:hypothetical protein
MFALTRNLWTSRKTTGRRTSYKPHFEVLERREVLSAVPLITPAVAAVVAPADVPSPTPAGLALINSLPDTPVRTAALADYQRDGLLSRNDLIQILHDSTGNYTYVLPNVVGSLQTLVDNASTVGMPDYVRVLTAKTIAGVAEMGLGTAAAQTLGINVNNYFLGKVHPAAAGNNYYDYSTTHPAKTLLWNASTGPSYQDVIDGSDDPNLSFIESLGAIARRNPGDIEQMFIDNGDYTYTVRIYNGGKPDYVTVDECLPETTFLFSPQVAPYLWAGLAEKAYVQETTMDYTTAPGLKGGANYSASVQDGAAIAWSAFTGTAITPYRLDAGAIATAFKQGNYVVLQGNGNALPDIFQPYGILDLEGEYVVLAQNAYSIQLAPVTGTSPITDTVIPPFYVANSVLGNYFSYWYEAAPPPNPIPPVKVVGLISPLPTTGVNALEVTAVSTPPSFSTTTAVAVDALQTLAVQNQTTTNAPPSTVLTASTSHFAHLDN